MLRIQLLNKRSKNHLYITYDKKKVAKSIKLKGIFPLILSIFLLDIRFHDHQLKQMSGCMLVRYNINFTQDFATKQLTRTKWQKLYSSTPYSAGVLDGYIYVIILYNNNLP